MPFFEVKLAGALAEGDVGRTGTGIAGKSTANASSGLDVAVANLQDYCNGECQDQKCAVNLTLSRWICVSHRNFGLELENRLLSRFDVASHKRELATMAECAKILVQVTNLVAHILEHVFVVLLCVST